MGLALGNKELQVNFVLLTNFKKNSFASFFLIKSKSSILGVPVTATIF